MSEEKKKPKIKITLGNKMKELYENDPALNSLKKFEEERKSLLNLDAQDITNLGIEDRISGISKLLESSELHSTFKNEDLFKEYTDPILSSIHDKDYKSLQEKMKLATESFIKPDYATTIKATDILGETISRADSLSSFNTLNKVYTSQLDETIEQLKNKNKLGAASGILGLASTINTDLFKTQLIQPTALSKSLKNVEKTNALNFKPITSEIPKINLNDMPVVKLPKYEDTLMGKADKQIEHLKNISAYMIDQNEKMKIQHEISIKQNEIIQNQIEDNTKTSVRDYRALIFSIVISILLSIIIYLLEDKSDTENHNEIRQTLETNNNNKILKNLVEELKIQNQKSDKTIKELKKQNDYIQRLLEVKGQINK
ncbi:MAG: hypothetical protein OIF32_01395 [Campylobacterales bacterium]|nr:hypothetical protein [Campylobacterales bacterium]